MKSLNGGLEDPRVQAFLAHHFRTAHAVSPPGSAHALDLSGYVPDANSVFMTGANATCMADLLDMSVKLFLLYLLAWSLAALSPGLAVICSMAQSTRYGFRSSLAGICGIQVGSSLLFIFIALGLGTMLATASVVFAAVRVVGAIYLFYLGARIVIHSFQHSAVQDNPSALSAEHQNLFLQGALIQLTNPKALLFISALLPQFIDPHGSVPLQLVILLLATIAIDTVVLSSYAYFAQKGVRSFRASRFSGWVERVFGAALVVFGIRLLSSRR